MLLIHDLVEIDAGDTYAYSGVSKEEQHAKEEKGAARIFGMLPKEKGEKLYALWQEFEAGETAEARFAHAMDNIQPMMLNDYTDGKAWRQFGVSLSKIYKRNELTPKGSRVLWKYAKEKILAPNVETGRIRDE